LDLEIAGKRAIVLGSTAGLGQAIAQALALEGVSVLVTGRSDERVNAVLAVLNNLKTPQPGDAFGISADLGDPATAKIIYTHAVETMGGVDILINNTGGPKPEVISDVVTDTWASSFAAMVMPVMDLTRLCLPAMRDHKWGRIITCLSSGVMQPVPYLGVSNSLRAGLVGWSKTLASEVAKDGITVNGLVPGRIATDRTAALDIGTAKRLGKTIEEVSAQSRSTIPVGRYGRVEEFAAVAAFLASKKASYVTGSVVRVDGGMIRSI